MPRKKKEKVQAKKPEKIEASENKEKPENQRQIEKIPKKSLDKQLLWVLGWMIFLIILFLMAYSIFKEYRKVEYQGMTFTRAKFGQIPVYHYYYFFKDKTGQTIKYNLYLRNDPRKNNIPVTGEIDLIGDKPLFLGINNTGVIECSQSAMAVADLYSFLSDNQMSVYSGTTDLNESIVKDQLYVSCNKHPENTVIIVQKAETSSININNNCYTINVADCQVLEAIEKFKLQAIADARNRQMSTITV